MLKHQSRALCPISVANCAELCGALVSMTKQLVLHFTHAQHISKCQHSCCSVGCWSACLQCGRQQRAPQVAGCVVALRQTHTGSLLLSRLQLLQSKVYKQLLIVPLLVQFAFTCFLSHDNPFLIAALAACSPCTRRSCTGHTCTT